MRLFGYKIFVFRYIAKSMPETDSLTNFGLERCLTVKNILLNLSLWLGKHQIFDRSNTSLLSVITQKVQNLKFFHFIKFSKNVFPRVPRMYCKPWKEKKQKVGVILLLPLDLLCCPFGQRTWRGESCGWNLEGRCRPSGEASGHCLKLKSTAHWL